MVSGVGTSSGFEERIRFSELEIVDRDAIDSGVITTIPEGNYINGWDVNVSGVRLVSVKRNIRYHKHAVSISTCQAGRVNSGVRGRIDSLIPVTNPLGVHLAGQEKK